MDAQEANTLRCVAADIIIKLYHAGAKSQLTLLEDHINVALNRLDEAKKEDTDDKQIRTDDPGV